MAKQLQAHFEVLFDEYVPAYRKRYSCQSVLLDLIDQWRSALDNTFYVGALFMDLSKCVDCMPHALLISKLDTYGETPEACQLICNYFATRQRIGAYVVQCFYK